MSEFTSRYEVNEYLEPELRYMEEVGRTVRSLPVRYCYLWQDGKEAPFSELEVLSFRQRFGAVSVPAEGIGGVETDPKFRRQGYMTRLLTKAVEGMTRRVDVAFISEAIEGVYEKFGFINCVAEAHFSIELRHLEHLLGHSVEQTGLEGIRVYTPDDLPAMVRLYNEAHALRPWTHERHPDWNRLFEQQMWQPGSETMVFERGGGFRGYAILRGQPFGHINIPLSVDELTALDTEAVQSLFAAIAAKCWQLRQSGFLVREPLDSLAGREARRLGCEYHQSYPASGGMMGAILNRERLLQQLEPELRRRSSYDERSDEHPKAFRALQRGDIVPDNRILLGLLLGHWSAADAQTAGTEIPAQYKRICAAWFPGGETQVLPTPYAHKLDRY
jgi:GNAT superfamily N-acetyltransferase